MTPTYIVGLDIGKAEHHAVALDQTSTVVFSERIPNTEAALKKVFTGLPEPPLVVVDLAGSIGTLPVTVAQSLELTVAVLSPATMRQMAEILPGTAKTDARDAWVIAESARRVPITLRVLRPATVDLAEVRLLCGYDADLRKDATTLANRLRSLLANLHPALERVLGPNLHRAGVLDLLATAPTPAALQALSRDDLIAALRQHKARHPEDFVDRILTALAEQTVEPAGTGALVQILPRLAGQLADTWRHRAELKRAIMDLVTAHPRYPIVVSLPGFGPRTTATFLVETSGKEFATAGRLASYAGVAPVPWQSGGSTKQVRTPRHGNPRLKDACYQAAFSSIAALPASRQYYDRKREAGKTHSQAVLCLARRRMDVLYAMLRDGATYTSDASEA